MKAVCKLLIQSARISFLLFLAEKIANGDTIYERQSSSASERNRRMMACSSINRPYLTATVNLFSKDTWGKRKSCNQGPHFPRYICLPFCSRHRKNRRRKRLLVF